MKEQQKEQSLDATTEASAQEDADNKAVVAEAPSSFFLQDTLPGILQTMSCSEGCSFDCWEGEEILDKDTNKTEQEEEPAATIPWMQSFEEYDDDTMDVPILLHSPNQHLDADATATTGAGDDDNGDTRGLEAMLTLPEV